MASSIPTIEMQYETQLLGFCSDDLYASVRDIVVKAIQRNITSLGSAIKKKVGAGAAVEDSTLDKALNILQQEMTTTSERPLLSLQKLLSDLLGIPPHVLLPEDMNQHSSYTSEEEEMLRHKIKELMEREKKVQYMREILSKELKIAEGLEVVAEQLENLKKTTSHLADELAKGDAISPQLHTLASSALGLEVVGASLEISDSPNAGESPVELRAIEINSYCGTK